LGRPDRDRGQISRLAGELPAFGRHRGLCNPERLAGIVYDMRVGVVRQIPDWDKVTGRVLEVLTAAPGGRLPGVLHPAYEPAASAERGIPAPQGHGLAAGGFPRGGHPVHATRLAKFALVPELTITHPFPVPVNGEA